jgi:thiol-disulfide isomerase/thioredoxin
MENMGKMKKALFIILILISLSTTLSVHANSDNGKPMVTFITAEGCETCTKIKPIIEELKQNYSKELDFITFDISSRRTLEEAKTSAQENKITKFFDENKTIAPFIGFLCPNGKIEKSFIGETEKSIYVKALDEFLSGQKSICSL